MWRSLRQGVGWEARDDAEDTGLRELGARKPGSGWDDIINLNPRQLHKCIDQGFSSVPLHSIWPVTAGAGLSGIEAVNKRLCRLSDEDVGLG